MSYTKFAQQLPPLEDWGERVYTRPELEYPQEINAAAELIDRNVALGRGDLVAIYYKDQVITYNELLKRVNKMGNALTKMGIGIGDRVLMRFPNNPTAVAAWLACLKIGGVAVMIMPMLRSREISYRANDAECKLVLCDIASIDEVRKAEPAMDTVKKILVTDGTDNDYETFESHWHE